MAAASIAGEPAGGLFLRLGPMTTIELARHVMAERGLNTADKALLPGL
jgi:hypothetical protein